MKIIQKLSDKIEEEIHDAKHYAKWAIEVKEEYPNLAQTLYNIANQEMEHMRLLHESVVQVINDYRAKNGDPPANMMAVYDYLHGKHIDDAADAKRLLSMF